MSRGRADPLVFAIASVVLSYPSPDILAGRAELVELAASLPRSAANDALRTALGWWAAEDAQALATAYVATFDLHRRTSLYLSYYVFGDRRQRGQQFVRLKRLYEAAGLRLAGRELPDYLPLVLEFAALEPEAGFEVLGELQVGLELLRAALIDEESRWAPVVAAVAADLPDLDEAGRGLVHRLAEEGPPGEEVGLEPFAPPEVMPEASRR